MAMSYRWVSVDGGNSLTASFQVYVAENPSETGTWFYLYDVAVDVETFKNTENFALTESVNNIYEMSGYNSDSNLTGLKARWTTESSTYTENGTDYLSIQLIVYGDHDYTGEYITGGNSLLYRKEWFEDPDDVEPVVPNGGGNITDKYNNTFVIEGGFDSSYNAGYSSIKWWYTDIDCSDTEEVEKHRISDKYSPELEQSSSESFSSKVITLTLDYENPKYPRYICAELMLYNEFMAGVPIYIYGTVNQYLAPVFSENTKPIITTDSGKLTLKEPWILSWPAATKLNDNSPVKGYFFCLTNNTTNTNVVLKSPEGYPTIGNPVNNWYYCSPSSSLEEVEIYIDPAQSGIVPGNDYVLYVGAYTQYGSDNDGDKCPDPNGADAFEGPTYIYSATYTAKNNGVLQVKVDGEWKEGQVFVKTTQGWKEADTVYVKTADGWKESQ